ncbi:MAG TPA: hypothetical protein VEK07_23365 [Polyangiaceae bacterium]|nr:hypothetical protein [Polyangiaceae bacterium]
MLARATGIALAVFASGELSGPPLPNASSGARSTSVAGSPSSSAGTSSASGGKGMQLVAASSAARRPQRAGPPQPPPPALPRANVRFTIVAPATSSGWFLQVVNDGEVPVRILADTRLLALEVTPRSARRPVRCELPTPMRPADPLERAIVVPPKTAFREKFEPRLYCFGTEGFDALAPGAIVVARLGPNDKGAGSTPPELSAIDGVEPVIAPEQVLSAPPIALPDEALAREAAQPQSPDPTLDIPRLKLESPRALDADAPEAAEVPVTLRNEGSLPVTVRFRPETIGFDVLGSVGASRCSWPMRPTAPTRELFTTLPPKASVELTVTLQAYCADEVLARSGIVAIRPFLETRGASGAPLGLRTFEGRLTGSSITFVRVQRGRLTEPLLRPQAQGR